MCSSVADRLVELWVILLWPFWVVLCGLCTGYLAAKASGTAPSQTRTCLAACAFSNSTGLVITLLEVIRKEFSKRSMEGIDPTALLSVYLLLYPVLQWGMGGWLLAPEEKEGKGKEENGVFKAGQAAEKWAGEASPLVPRHRRTWTLPNILNNEPLKRTPSFIAGQEEFGGVGSGSRRLIFSDKENKGQRWYTTTEKFDSSNDVLHMMVRELSFASLASHRESLEDISSQIQTATSEIDRTNTEWKSDDEPLTMDAGAATAALDSLVADLSTPTIHENSPLANGRASSPPLALSDGLANYKTLLPSDQQIESIQKMDVMPLSETLLRIFSKVLQPPVIGSLLGFFIATFPTLRGLFENIHGENGKTAPLKCVFDGVHKVGLAAVPINMTILGINLSSTFQKKTPKDSDKKNMLLPNRTMVAVVMGKMMMMPICGMFSVWFLQQNFIIFPEAIDSTCYLVMMIVFITPTANNVMVMVELSGNGSKEGIARLIGWQYVVCPVIMSIVLTIVVSLATGF